MAEGSNNIMDRLRDRSAETVTYVRSQIAQRGAMVIFVSLALLIIALLVTFLVLRLRTVSTSGTLVVAAPIKLYNMTSQVRVEGADLPATLNGQEFSISFWLYLVDFVPTTDGPQLILMRGGDLAAATPIIALDGNSNRMRFAVRTTQSTAATPTTVFNASSKYVTAEIDYFPLQRWTHVVMVVRDDKLDVYMNNSLYTVANVTDITTTGTGEQRPLFVNVSGPMFVGAYGTDGMREPRAFLAQLKFFNYAVTPKQVASVYASGPTSSSLLSKLGLSGYGLRSPIYRVEA